MSNVAREFRREGLALSLPLNANKGSPTSLQVNVLVSVTRLRLRSAIFLPQFAWLNERVVRQIVKTAGFLEGKLLLDRHLTFWTMTRWEAVEAMWDFRDGGPHREVMTRLVGGRDEASVVQIPDRVALSSWEEAHSLMVEHGRASRVRHPTMAHVTRQSPAVRRVLPERRCSDHRRWTILLIDVAHRRNINGVGIPLSLSDDLSPSDRVRVESDGVNAAIPTGTG